MTREEVKAALKSYRALKREHDDLVRRREEIEASILGSPRLDGMPHGGSVSNPTARLGASLAELDVVLDKKIKERAAALILIESLLDFVSDAQKRMVVRLVYVDGMNYRQIAEKINYCDRTVGRMVSAAVEEIAETCH